LGKSLAHTFCFQDPTPVGLLCITGEAKRCPSLMAFHRIDCPGLFQHKGLPTVSEDANKPVRELVAGFKCGDQMAWRKSSWQPSSNLFFEFLPMVRRVPGYRRGTIVT
jgi:hypothetical protein